MPFFDISQSLREEKTIFSDQHPLHVYEVYFVTVNGQSYQHDNKHG